VLVVVYARSGKVLLLRRADHPDFWQSVTGSMHWDEQQPHQTALRELEEETGLRVSPPALLDLGLIQRFPILPQWRGRYAPDVLENIEHAFALELVQEAPITLAPREHSEYAWFGFDDAQRKVSSWTNREAIRQLQQGIR